LALKAALCRLRFAFISLLILIYSRPTKVELNPWSSFRGPPQIEDVTERLKRLPFYEVEEIRAGKQPGRKRLLEELARVATQIWNRISEDDQDLEDDENSKE
jgi:hypothetical protein